MNRYKILGMVNGQPVAAQHVKAPTARVAVQLHREDYPNVEVTEVWRLQEIAREFWTVDAPSPEVPETAGTRVVAVPTAILEPPASENHRRQKAAKWAEMTAAQGRFAKWHPIFTDGRVTHYQFD
jgi:hypothetical protein